jgi:hypothetical protein
MSWIERFLKCLNDTELHVYNSFSLDMPKIKNQTGSPSMYVPQNIDHQSNHVSPFLEDYYKLEYHSKKRTGKEIEAVIYVKRLNLASLSAYNSLSEYLQTTCSSRPSIQKNSR